MNTNRTLQLPQSTQLNKSKEFIDTSQQGTDKMRLSPNISSCEIVKEPHERSIELIKSLIPTKSDHAKEGNNLKDLSAIAYNESEAGNLTEWFTSSIDKMKELKNIFTLIVTNEDVKSLESDVRQRIVEQSLYAQELINISLKLLDQNLENKASTSEEENKFKEEQRLICGKVKEMHKETIKIFNEKEYLPLKFYKPWVVSFRQLKQITDIIPLKIHIQQSKQVR